MIVVGGAAALLSVFNTSASNFWDLVCIFNFLGAGAIAVCCIIKGSGSPYANEALDISLARNIADTYVLAWNYYQKYEKAITKAWLFQSSKFLREIKFRCVWLALNERCNSDYDGCRVYIPKTQTKEKDNQWKMSISKQEILSPTSVCIIANNIPDLAAAFDFELAAKATNAELIQRAIPQRDDPRTTIMCMPVWNEEDQAWRIREVKRREAATWPG